VFGIAGVLLVGSGLSIWRARRLPCPIDPVAARSCTRLRKLSAVIYAIAVLCFVTGGTLHSFLPALG
jgi:uncharacterized iron-regulated membrane protein